MIESALQTLQRYKCAYRERERGVGGGADRQTETEKLRELKGLIPVGEGERMVPTRWKEKQVLKKRKSLFINGVGN